MENLNDFRLTLEGGVQILYFCLLQYSPARLNDDFDCFFNM